ncbi:MAG: hypothetical protein QOF39_3140 [Frankiales bacterium]|jgi:hypothetical protein|nr:hypothetical protein [Frankiales bacterium]
MASDTINWTTVSSLATGIGTLVLAAATFASVRSANRTARLTEASHQADLRPLLLPSRFHDAAEKVGFVDGRWFKIAGGRGIAEVEGDVVYLLMSLRNVGTGIAVLHAWHLTTVDPDPQTADAPDVEDFRRLTRDLYIPVGDNGFWQGAFRDPSEPDFQAAVEAIKASQPLTIDVLYGDHEGGQRVVSRFVLTPHEDAGHILAASRHWNIDRPDPR